MNKTNWEDLKEVAEEGFKEGKENWKKIDKFCNDHPWFLPSVRLGLIASAYLIGRKHGVKTGRIEYFCDPDIKGNLEMLFNRTAENLDLIDEAIKLSETKITKF